MNIVDIIILLGLIVGALTGFASGFLNSVLKFVGTIVVVVLAFLFKNPLSIFLYNNLPFTKFSGLTSLNILLYELIAFIICIIILSIVLALLIKITGLIEKILTFTVVLALPSKLLGMLVGIIKSVVIIYVILFIASMPVLKLPFISESKYAKVILTKTPFMSSVMDSAIKTIDEIAELTKDSIQVKDTKGTNTKIIEIMLENNITSSDCIKILVEKKKIDINNANELIEKYKEVENG